MEGAPGEELLKLKKDIEKIKETILGINKNIGDELEYYPKNRNEKLKRIMSYTCYCQNEIAKKITEFVSNEQKEFPVFDSTEINSAAFETPEDQKGDEFENVENVE